MLYYNLSEYFRRKYGKRLKKICIDGGFSCPNRDGTCGSGGCIFCGERGSGDHIDPAESITEQVKRALSEALPDDMFVAYFQNFTNTYAPIDVLKERYDSALVDDRIKILAVGTRPDCIDEDVCRLISGYRDRCDIWVELGLQTSSDKTAEIINRGYKSRVFEEALRLLEKYGIPTVVHLIVGLPGEGIEEIKNTAEYISRFKLFGVKIHSIYVSEGTRLAEMYRAGQYTPPKLSEFVDSAVYLLTHISPDTVVHRLTGDCPRDMLIAPEWNADKHKIISEINKSLESQGLAQGCKYKKSPEN